MAQIGCFVPAVFATFRITNQIFSRIGSDDDIESNSSTFMLEMKEVSYILQNLASNSLVIMDELGRGTSNEEGVGICHSVCEYLLNSKAFTFFATHYLELSNLENLYPSVESYHFDIKIAEDKSISHLLQRGKLEPFAYGLSVAAVSSLPPQVLGRALLIEKQLARNSSIKVDCGDPPFLSASMYKLATILMQASENSSMKIDELQKYFSHIRSHFREEKLFL
jgi:DNA mismatch repair protein MSH4